MFKETKMNFALIGAAALAAAAFATPALAQAVISAPGYCAEFYPNANCQNLGPGNPYTATAATIATPCRTATHSWSIVGTVTIGRTADRGSRSGRCPAARESARRTTEQAGLLRRDHQRFEVDTQRLGNAGAVGRIGFGAVGDMPLLDMLRRRAELTGRVFEQRLLLSRNHFAE
jgi:hypothetical protein